MSETPKKKGRPKRKTGNTAKGEESKLKLTEPVPQSVWKDAVAAKGEHPGDAVRFSNQGLFEFLSVSPDVTHEKVSAILKDERARLQVADRIERIVTDADFSARFGGTNLEPRAELERISRWLEWRPDTPASILSRAWGEVSTRRALFLSRWMLLNGTEKDRKELKRLQRRGRRSFKEGLRELVSHVATHGEPPPSSPARMNVSDSAVILAMVVCGAMEATSDNLSGMLIDAWISSLPKAQQTQTTMDSARRRISKALFEMGFSKKTSPARG